MMIKTHQQRWRVREMISNLTLSGKGIRSRPIVSKFRRMGQLRVDDRCVFEIFPYSRKNRVN